MINPDFLKEQTTPEFYWWREPNECDVRVLWMDSFIEGIYLSYNNA